MQVGGGHFLFSKANLQILYAFSGNLEQLNLSKIELSIESLFRAGDGNVK